MNKSYILDTNIILRLLLEDDPSQYKQAKQLFLEAKQGNASLSIPEIVIFEIHFGLKKFYHLGKEEIIEKLKALFSTKYLHVESKEIFLSALNLYLVENVSFVDCFLAAKAKIEGKELFTFDKKLQKLC